MSDKGRELILEADRWWVVPYQRATKFKQSDYLKFHLAGMPLQMEETGRWLLPDGSLVRLGSDPWPYDVKVFWAKYVWDLGLGSNVEAGYVGEEPKEPPPSQKYPDPWPDLTELGKTLQAHKYDLRTEKGKYVGPIMDTDVEEFGKELVAQGMWPEISYEQKRTELIAISQWAGWKDPPPWLQFVTPENHNMGVLKEISRLEKKVASLRENLV